MKNAKSRDDVMTTVRWPKKNRAELELACLVRGETISEYIRRVVMEEVGRELEE